MKKYENLPAVCIVGRPNVGKSSLFNCLLQRRQAVVVEESGTTRDRVEAILDIDEVKIRLVDTGGYMPEDKEELYLQVKEQIFNAMEEASVILMVADTISGISPYDEEVAALLRKFNKPVIFAANKADNNSLEDEAVEFYRLGFKKIEIISCLHRKGINNLQSRVLESIKNVLKNSKKTADKGADQTVEPVKIAVVGRPNVGKSSFINNLLQRKRIIVSALPGTTRDSIDTYFHFEGDNYILIDTAGIRHRRKVKTAVDAYSMMRSTEAIKRSDVSLLLLDAADGITRDDTAILSFIEKHGKACVILVNKWDLSEGAADVTAEDYEKSLVSKSARLNKFPVSFISSKTGKNVLASISMAKLLYTNLDLKFPTPALNKIFKKNSPLTVAVPRNKKKVSFYYITQSKSRPIEFLYFVSDPFAVRVSHRSFIENQLRANLPLLGIPIKIHMKKSRKATTYGTK
jgi:GTP-binding protein